MGEFKFRIETDVAEGPPTSRWERRELRLRVIAIDQAGAVQIVQEALQGMVDACAEEIQRRPDQVPVEGVQDVKGRGCRVYTSLKPGDEVRVGDSVRLIPLANRPHENWTRRFPSWKVLGVEGSSGTNARALMLETEAFEHIKVGDALWVGRPPAR